MKFKWMNRQLLVAAIIIFYLIPLLSLSAYSMTLMSPHKSWTILSLGLLLVVMGTLTLMLLLFYWEQTLQSKKVDFFSSSTLKPSTPSLGEKEDKVTSLDPSLIFDSSSHTLTDSIGLKETSKELNLLQTALKASQEQQEQLAKDLEIKNQELQKQGEENRLLQLKVEKVAQDFADYKLFSEEQLKQKQLQLGSLQQIIEDQRTEMERREEQIHQLDTKVHDLSYEIKTLLYLHKEETASPQASADKREELAPAPLPDIQEENSACAVLEGSPHLELSECPIRTTQEALHLLKKCVGFAQKMTGSHYYGNESSRYREFSSSYFAIDQRRLFDNLRGETGALIVVYSQKENRLLFANHEAKALLGWSSEKFINDFFSIIQEGMNDWKKALNHLATASDAQARLLAKTKNGQEVLLSCHLGVIPSGLFRHYIIGILYPA